MNRAVEILFPPGTPTTTPSNNGGLDVAIQKLHGDVTELSSSVKKLENIVAILSDRLDRIANSTDLSVSDLRERLSSTQAGLLTVRAKQVGWHSLAWAIGMGLANLITHLTGGGHSSPIP